MRGPPNVHKRASLFNDTHCFHTAQHLCKKPHQYTAPQLRYATLRSGGAISTLRFGGAKSNSQNQVVWDSHSPVGVKEET